MKSPVRITLAQLNLVVGDIPGNTNRIIEAINSARDIEKAQLIVFQELAITGYPPEDLLFHAGLRNRVGDALNRIRKASSGIAVLLGYPEYENNQIFNSAVFFHDQDVLGNYRKWCLPNYSVFDEQRYFTPGTDSLVVTVGGLKLGITLCQDAWESTPCLAAAHDGAQMIISLNGSPFELDKQSIRESVLKERVGDTGLPFVYQNLVGGQDELVFDGGSFAIGADGEVCFRAPAFEEGLFSIDVGIDAEGRAEMLPGVVCPVPSKDECVYKAVVSGIRDYVQKNGFEGIVLGLSGGIDSALCMAAAVDALGPDAVEAVMMPYRYTSEMSLEDAEQQAATQGARYRVIPIEPMVDATLLALKDVFEGLPADSAEENIQARCRGVLLMAISNKTHRIVLATGNKSEMAVGYATLYGDMAGGFAPLKDCTKTQVYRLARYRNGVSPVIPERVITRAPSAELRPDQKDSDSLPDYEILDTILDALMLDDSSVDQISASGINHDVVGSVLDMVRRNEYKRRQSSPGVRISGRAFGRDWRYPITSGYGRSN
ncbi:MAG: NAD+ synthase [Gammaproteobacteria bacterium]